MTREPRLHISDELRLPLSWMTLATVVYGARGSGKTTLGSVIAEEVTKAKQRFCAIDLKGDWYGLKSTADGKGDGIPVVVFGGDHADVPLEEGAGAFIGETIAQLEQPSILDLEYLSKGKQVRFLAAFFEALYDRNRDPLLVLADEAQRYAPQKPIDPDAAKCLGAVEDLVKLGRKHGIGPMLFTQRGSGLNKEVSELCDMMVAFRTPGPLDQDRVKDWLDANTTRAQREEVMGALAGLPTGTAIFASGHPDLKIFGTYPVRRRETFDSSATPKVGHRRVEPKRLAKPDLEQLRTKMAAAIERQKAEDPAELRRVIATLRAELRKAQQAVAPVVVPAPRERVRVVEKSVLRDGQLARAEKLTDALGILLPAITAAIRAASAPSAGVTSGAARSAPGSAVAPAARPRAPRKQRDGTGVLPTTVAAAPSSPRRTELRAPARTTEGISAAQQRILDAAVFLGGVGVTAPHVVQLALFAGQSATGGYWRANIGRLRTLGLIEGTSLTAAGHAAARASDITTVEQLHDHVFTNLLRGAEKQILRVLIDVYPDALAPEMVGERAGLVPAGGYWRASVGRLRSLGLITKTAPMAAQPVLFLEARV